MDEKYSEFNEQVTLGETLCINIKQIYFIDNPWCDCYRLIASKLTDAKKKARLFYSDKSETDVLKELNKLSNDCLKAFMENDEIA